MLGKRKNQSKASKDSLPPPCKLAGFGSLRSQKKVETAWPNGQSVERKHPTYLT